MGSEGSDLIDGAVLDAWLGSGEEGAGVAEAGIAEAASCPGLC